MFALRSSALAAVASLAALGLCIWSLRPAGDAAPAGSLTVYCAAGLRAPVEALVEAYRDELGDSVRIQYGGSGTLLAQLEVGSDCDLYLAADASFVRRARQLGLVAEELELARLRPVIGVRAGNPRGVATIAELASGDLAVGLADPEAAAVGAVAREALAELGAWEAARENARVVKPTVGDLVNDLRVETLDAAVVWDASLHAVPGLEAVRVPALDARVQRVTVGVGAASPRPAAALRLARFLASADRGAPVWRERGFEALPGDPFAARPRVALMGGAMLNAAVDETIEAFAEREGVDVDRIYNGCGLLVAQMRTGAWPDAYFSCDVRFLDAVADAFEPGRVLTANPIVILTGPGNPLGIASLADLARDGLRVGLAHPEKSALGALTYALLDETGERAAFDASGNLALDSPTGDFLVNQLRAGGLDAVVVYRSNAARAGELALVEIAHPAALAHQPFAIRRDSPHRALLGRLLTTIEAPESRERFEELGFRWEASDG